MSYYAGDYEVAVIGAGHAGCEAALACSRKGHKTLLFSISLECVANMPCNPNIGGTSKGHLVREIDALGGEMGKNIDKTFIQSRMLNTSKGPAVYSLRAQADRKKYQQEMKHTLEKQENLSMKQAEIVDIKVEDGKVTAVETNIGAIYGVKAVIIATGTYLKGKIFIGETNFESGPDGVFPANKLSKCLKNLGIKIVRFKTGTPARVNRRTIDFSKMEIQEAVKNNIEKFPERYCFKLSDKETNNLRSKDSTSKINGHGGRRYNQRVFTEQGVYMLATILKSKLATSITIAIMDAFVAMKSIINTSLIEQKYFNELTIKNTEDIKLLQESFDKLNIKESNNHIFYEGQIYDAYLLLYCFSYFSLEILSIFSVYIFTLTLIFLIISNNFLPA